MKVNLPKKMVAFLTAIFIITGSVYTGVATSGVSPIEVSYMNGYSTAIVGQNAPESTMQLVDGWYSGRTRYSTTEFVSGHSGAGCVNAVKINSDVAEGWRETNGFPLNLQTGWYTPLSNVEAIMIYVELPENMPADSWYMGIYGGFTAYDGSNNAYYGKYPSAVYQYLPQGEGAWKTSTTDKNSRFTAIGSGYKGYIKIYIENIDSVTNGVWTQESRSMSVDQLSLSYVGFDIAYIGGNYGEIYYGGQYVISKDSSSIQAILPAANQPIDLVTVKNPQSIPLNVDGSFNIKKAVGDELDSNFQILDKGWGNQSSATGICAAPLENAVSSSFSIKVSSENAEGYRLSPAIHSYLTDNAVWIDLADAQSIIFQVKLPKEYKAGEGSQIRFTGLAALVEDANVYSGGNGLEYSYLETDGEAWIKAGKTDTYGDMILPSGFEGYIAVAVPDKFKGPVSSLWSYEIRFGAIGGEYGDFYLGGIYTTGDFNEKLSGKVGENDAVSMTSEAPNDGPAYVSGDYNSMIIAKPFKRNKTSNDTVDPTIALLDKGWGNPTKSVLQYSDSLENTVAAQNAVKLSSDVEEGFRSSSFPYIKFSSALDLTECTHLMLHLKLPIGVDSGGSSELRFTEIKYLINGEAQNSAFGGVSYQYLARKSDQWVDGGVTDEYGGVILPSGFEGYVILDLASLITEKTINSLNLVSCEIRPGNFGGLYGDFYLGGLYGVYEFKNLLMGKTLKTEVASMTSYIENNLAAMNDFKEAVDSIGTVDFRDLSVVERAREIFENLVPKDQEKISSEYLQRLISAENALSVYKPTFKGFTVKDNSEGNPALKVGATVSLNHYTPGYTLSKCGIVAIEAEKLFDNTLSIGTQYSQEMNVASTSANGEIQISAIMEVNDISHYKTNYIFRAYAMYVSISNPSDVIITYNNPITYSDGNTSAMLKGNVLQIANYAGLSIYSER